MSAPRLGLSLVVWCIASAAYAQAPLAWKLDKGQVLEMESTTAQKQAVKIKDSTFHHETKTTTHFRLSVRDVRADGFVIDAAKTKIEQQIIKDGKAQPADDSIPATAFTLLVSPNGRLIEFQGYEEFLKKLASQQDKNKLSAFRDEARIKILRRTYPEEALKESFADLFGPLADAERSYVEPISLFGSLRSVAKYTPADMGKITYTISTKYELPKDTTAGLFRILKGDIESEMARGTITFDLAVGRMIEHQRSMTLRGTLTIDAMDRQQPLEFTSENKVYIRVKK